MQRLALALAVTGAHLNLASADPSTPSTASVSSVSSVSLDSSWVDEIQASFSTSEDVKSTNQCVVTENEPCDISDMEQDQTTMV